LEFAGFEDEAVEDGSTGGADVVAALGMPLDGEDELGVGMFHVEQFQVGLGLGCLSFGRFGGNGQMFHVEQFRARDRGFQWNDFGRIGEWAGCCEQMFHVEQFGGWGEFEGLDDTVIRAAGDDAEVLAGGGYGLVVAGVDGEPEEVTGYGGFFRGEEGGKEAFGGDEDGVGDGDAAAGFVVDGERCEVLEERTAGPDVEGLEAEADGKNGLAGGSGVVEEEVVGGLARGVGAGGGGVAGLAVEGGVNVGGTAGEENAVAGGGEGEDLGRGEGEVDRDGVAAGAGDGGGVGRGRTLVIRDVDGSSYWDGDAHRVLDVRGKELRVKHRARGALYIAEQSPVHSVAIHSVAMIWAHSVAMIWALGVGVTILVHSLL
jgi:hypothetical protein